MDMNLVEGAARATAGVGVVSGHREPADRQRVKHSGPLRTAVVVNPARVEGLDELRDTISATLAGAGWPAPLWFETTPEDPGAGQARRAVAEGAEVVFVSGGDGTVRSCVEGLAGTEAALAVLPAGTGNLLATNLGLPDDPAEGVRVAVERGRHLLDVGEVDGQAFAVMAGMGFDAKLLEDASTTLKARIGSLAYVLSALKHLRDRPMRVEIRVDDGPPLRRRARTVVVGNVGRLQGGVRLLADAEPDNGQLDVAILAPRHLAHWAALAWGVLRRHEHVPRMEVRRGSRITVTSDRDQPCQLDGDVIEPRRTLDVTVRPAALWLCVYQPDRSPDLAEGSPKKS
jgi:YegS/Rv2252/BmrU family lipid kinase